MNPFPTCRNHFHPAWLLLLVPPLAGLAPIWWSDNPPVFMSQPIRMLLALVAILPVFWLRSSQVTGRTQRFLKELRTLLPGCLIAVIAPGLIALSGEREGAEWGVAAFGFGCLLMGASAFGSEFEQRTLAGLLSQPLARRVLFTEKLAPLGLLLAFATLNLRFSLIQIPMLSYGPGEAAEVLLLPVFIFCSAPLFSLLSRSTLGALIFTLAVPAIGYLVGVLGLEALHRPDQAGEPLPIAWVSWLLWIGVPVYLLTTAGLGWRVFRGLEVREGGAGGRSSTGLHPVSIPMDIVLRRFSSVTNGQAQLVRKELRLHVVPWSVAGLMVGLWALWLGVRHFTRDVELRGALNQVSVLAVFAGMFGSLIIVGTGAASVAEERELGTLEWQLTQPVSVRRQWCLKVAVALVLSLVFGVLLPAFLLWLGFDREQLNAQFGEQTAILMAAYAGVFFLGFALSVYSSSIAPNTMKAVATTVGVAAGFAGVLLLAWLAAWATLHGFLSDLPRQWEAANAGRPAWVPSPTQWEIFWAGGSAVIVGLFVASLLRLGGRNCRRQVVPVRDIARQVAGVSAGLLLALSLFGAAGIQLMSLKQRSASVDARRMQRDGAINQVRQFINLGQFTPERAQHFSVATNASPEVVVDAVIAQEGYAGLYRLGERFRLQQRIAGSKFTIDPVLARRYGLVFRTNAVPPAKKP